MLKGLDNFFMKRVEDGKLDEAEAIIADVYLRGNRCPKLSKSDFGKIFSEFPELTQKELVELFLRDTENESIYSIEVYLDFLRLRNYKNLKFFRTESDLYAQFLKEKIYFRVSGSEDKFLKVSYSRDVVIKFSKKIEELLRLVNQYLDNESGSEINLPIKVLLSYNLNWDFPAENNPNIAQILLDAANVATLDRYYNLNDPKTWFNSAFYNNLLDNKNYLRNEKSFLYELDKFVTEVLNYHYTEPLYKGIFFRADEEVSVLDYILNLKFSPVVLFSLRPGSIAAALKKMSTESIDHLNDILNRTIEISEETQIDSSILSRVDKMLTYVEAERSERMDKALKQWEIIL